MAGFSDLVLRAQPAMNAVAASPTQGATWLWRFDLPKDDAGNLIDISTGATGVCKIVDGVLGSEILELTFVGGNGFFTVGKDEASTTGLVDEGEIAQYRWYCHVTKGGDRVQMWSSVDSPFHIRGE